MRPAVPAPEIVQVAKRLPKNLHMGTSSLSFPGWAGIVYAEQYRVPVLARHGLRAYAQHPLLNALNVDNTFYKPPDVDLLTQQAALVPEDFRFVVKAYTGLTTDPDSPRAHQRGIEPVFLNSTFAERAVIKPLMQAFGAKLAAVLFQFSPLGFHWTRHPQTFVAHLREFLSSLPRDPAGRTGPPGRTGPVYAIELRDPEILGPHYEEALAAVGAVHCCTVHSRMPPVDTQVSEMGTGPLIIRWMLQQGHDYPSASARFAPFSRILAPDKLSRSRIAGLVKRGLSARRDVYVLAANNAEGCAPLTLQQLAMDVVPPVSLSAPN